MKRWGFRGFVADQQRMKPSSLIVVGAAFLLALTACEQGTGKPKNANTRPRFGYQGTGGNETAFASPSPTPDPNATPKQDSLGNQPSTPITMPTPAPNPASASHEVPYGTPVPGKPGFVTSPHSPYAGYVDVRGFPPGTEVKCPYSGKIFLVP